MKRLIILLLFSASLLDAAVLTLSNRAKYPIQVERRDNKNPERIREKVTIAPGLSEKMQSGFYAIKSLVFKEPIARGSKKYEEVAILNPHIEPTDVFAEVIYFNKDDIAVHDEQSRAIKKSLKILEATGYFLLSQLLTIVTFSPIPYLVLIPHGSKMLHDV